VSVDAYPLPSNASLSALVGPASPLIGADYITVSFYGDSITWLNVYEPLIASALAASPHTAGVAVRILNQGVNGGTLADLIAGHSPWGHLNPSRPQTNITFAQTLAADLPDYVVVQIGINDVWQAGAACGARCSNVSAFPALFEAGIAAPVAAARGAQLVIASVSTIGELRDGGNALDAELDAFAAMQAALAARLGVPFVALRAADEAYEAANNCLGLPHGLLTYDGVHPTSPRGALNLANLHAGGLLAAMAQSPPAGPRPPPAPYAGRLFVTAAMVSTDFGGIAGADALCSAAAGEPAKALLVDETGCGGAPCRRATVTPWAGDGQLDWPLKPHAMYYSLDNKTAVGFTDAAGLLDFPLFQPVRAKCQNMASGMSTDWTTRAGKTCASWTAGADAPAGVSQGVGWTCALDDGLFDGGVVACGENDFICVTAA
jgi:lysophospholipase L1-like esterase